MLQKRHPKGNQKGGQFAPKSAPDSINKKIALNAGESDYIEVSCTCNGVMLGLQRGTTGWELAPSPVLSKIHLSTLSDSSEEFTEIVHVSIVANAVAEFLNENILVPAEVDIILDGYRKSDSEVLEDVAYAEHPHKEARDLLVSSIFEIVEMVTDLCSMGYQPNTYVPQVMQDHAPKNCDWGDILSWGYERYFGETLADMCAEHETIDPEILAMTSGIADICDDANGDTFSKLFNVMNCVHPVLTPRAYEGWPVILFSEYSRGGHDISSFKEYLQSFAWDSPNTDDLLDIISSDEQIQYHNPKATADITQALKSLAS